MADGGECRVDILESAQHILMQAACFKAGGDIVAQTRQMPFLQLCLDFAHLVLGPQQLTRSIRRARHQHAHCKLRIAQNSVVEIRQIRPSGIREFQALDVQLLRLRHKEEAADALLISSFSW